MNKENLSVGVLALDIVAADPVANMAAVKDCLARHGGQIDLLVLPELFTTAFSRDIEALRAVAEDDGGATVAGLKMLAREHDTAIAGSYLALIGGEYFNRGFIILPTGETKFYNKRHLFGLSAESRLFSAGEERPCVIEYCGWRIGLAVCYDLRFPVWCRHAADCPYDMLLVVANWPVARRYAWEHLLIARAIENQAVVVGADRSGSDDFGEHDSMTRVYDCTGHEVECREYGLLSIATLSHDSLAEHRRRWPFAKDADSFTVL